MSKVHRAKAMSLLSDQLETDYGMEILEELTGESLTRQGQHVRLLDQTGTTAECYFPDDGKGKPYVQNFQTGRRLYPITAYREFHGIDWKTAVNDLSKRYLGEGMRVGQKYRAQHTRPTTVKTPPPPVSYHDPVFVASTIGYYERNSFAVYLRRLFGVPVADELLRRFQVGTGGNWYVSPYWPRATIFWQTDEQNRVRAGKIIHYNGATGKRLKGKKTEAELRPDWVHNVRVLKDFHHEQCLFGLHQLSSEPANKPVAIVESEKTAVIATAFKPGLIWMACGGLGHLNADRCRVLAGRSVTLYPDLSRDRSAFNQWSEKATELQRIGCTVNVSDSVEKNATTMERHSGFDLADLLTRYRCANTGRVLNEPDGYPALWDVPNQPGAVPTIKMLSVNQYLSKSTSPTV